jgi:hypothetical protein
MLSFRHLDFQGNQVIGGVNFGEEFDEMEEYCEEATDVLGFIKHLLSKVVNISHCK